MRMKLLLALGFSLSFLVNGASSASALKARSSSTEPEAVESAVAKENSSEQHEHHKHKHKHHHKHHHGEAQSYEGQDPYHHHGFMRTNEHLLNKRSTSNNFLLGIEGGYASQKTQFDMTVTNFSPVPRLPALNGAFITQEETFTDNGALFGVLAGWQWRCKRLMLGIEGAVDFQSYEQNKRFAFTEGLTNTQSFNATALYDRGPTFSLSGRAGYFVTPFFFPYIRAGAQVSRDEVTFQSFEGPAPFLFPDFVSNNKTTVWGGLLGIGVEFPTYIGSSTIRVEYNYTESESISIQDGAFPMLGTYKFHKPQTNIGKVAWVWNFI